MKMEKTDLDTTATVLRVCAEDGIADNADLLRCAIMVKVLSSLGEKCRLRVADVGFEDSDYEGVRVFAYEHNGVVKDLAGRTGWDDVIQGCLDANRYSSDREWFRVENIDETDTLNDEIITHPGDFQPRVSRVSGLVLAERQAKALQGSTPQSAAVRRRSGL